MTPAAAVGIIAAAVGAVLPHLQADSPAGSADRLRPGRARSCRPQPGLVRLRSRHRPGAGARRQLAAGAAQAGKLHLAPGITGSLILFGLALLYAKQGEHPSAFSQILAPDHPGAGADRAGRLRLRRRHLLLSVPVHPDVDLWRDRAASCSRSGCSPLRPNTASPRPSSSSRRPARCCGGCCPASSCCRW